MSEALPILGFAAPSGTGKTTLLTRVLPELTRAGLRVAVIKHSHHDFEIDHPGKDSHAVRAAGAEQVLIASPYRIALIAERDGRTEPRLADLVSRLERGALDLVLVEGFRHEAFPKIEIHRPATGKPLLCLDDPHIIAVASDAEFGLDAPVPVLPLNDPAAVARFILDWHVHNRGAC